MYSVSSRSKLLVELCSDATTAKTKRQMIPNPMTCKDPEVQLHTENDIQTTANSKLQMIPNPTTCKDSQVQLHTENDIQQVDDVVVYVLDEIDGTLRPMASNDIGDHSELGMLLNNDITSLSLESVVVIDDSSFLENELRKNVDIDIVKTVELPSTLDEPIENDLDVRPVIAEEPTPLGLLTKSGNPRKRKRFETSVAERKAAKRVKEQEAHPVKPPCIGSCKIKCPTKLSKERQQVINSEYWAIEKAEDRRSFVIGSISREPVKRKTCGDNSRRSWTNIYHLKTEDGSRLQVCKTFFLATLGYDKSNDKIIQHLSKQASKVSPLPDKRKGRTPPNKINNEIIIKHIESFEPSISHYRREHAPKRRYLPSDLSITQMFQDFKQKHPEISCSYDLYRREVAAQKISFVKLGHEECEMCEHFNLHGHTKDDLQIQDCDTCKKWHMHIEKATEARNAYKNDAADAEVPDDNKVIYSVDMEKVIMLPRCEMFKSVIFTTRLTAYNESFAPVGRKSKLPIVACLWHDAIRGRNKEELISTFYKFLVTTCRDKTHIVLWMDNCSAQNKNWTFFTFLVFCVNAKEFLSVETLDIKYFEAGHTFMSCDSFHHLVEKSLHRQKVYDFEDFKHAVSASSPRVTTLEMKPNDFYKWKDCSKKQKIRQSDNSKTDKPLENANESTENCATESEDFIPYLKDIVQVQAKRGSNILYYKTKFEEQDWKELDFLAKASLKKALSLPSNHQTPKGISLIRKDAIVKNLLESEKGIVPESRFAFWKQLPVLDEDIPRTSIISSKREQIKKKRSSKK